MTALITDLKQKRLLEETLIFGEEGVWQNSYDGARSGKVSMADHHGEALQLDGRRREFKKWIYFLAKRMRIGYRNKR